MNRELLIVDDDVPFRIRLSKSMEKKGFVVESFSNTEQTKRRIEEKKFDFAIVDMRLEDGSGLELIKFINSKSMHGLALEGGSWAQISDRYQKTSFKDVSSKDILDKVLNLPIHWWKYRSDSYAKHVGPFAQDFYKLFQLGHSDRHIDMVDADGVAFAAITALIDEYHGKINGR